MKLVLLPGMDGTGLLFEEFIANCQYECLVIQLPVDGGQGYPELAIHIADKLPKEDYVLLAESFSGPLIPFVLDKAIQQPAAVILVASFLQAPRPFVISLISWMPLKQLMGFPGAKSILKFFCMKGASKKQFEGLWNLLKKLDFSLMKVRLKTIKDMIQPENKIDIPTLAIVAKQDRLVPRHISNQLTHIFSRLTIKMTDGPHFILQAEAVETAKLVNHFVAQIEQNNHV
jgi:pimeloyl-ACP methyl ester carboxylesterase